MPRVGIERGSRFVSLLRHVCASLGYELIFPLAARANVPRHSMITRRSFPFTINNAITTNTLRLSRGPSDMSRSCRSC